MSVVTMAPTARRDGRLREVIAFTLVGGLNTAIDFAVLNLLILLTQRHTGWPLFAEDCVAFTAAMVNSYLWNSRVTFKQQRRVDLAHFATFAGVSVIGLLMNGAVVTLVSAPLAAHVAPLLALNASKLLATFASLSWNYVAMRRWVFTPHHHNHPRRQSLRYRQPLAAPRVVRRIAYRVS